ncbi:Oleate activated transcription factor 3 [Madurella mycetomatis]|uniref:Oleate activated transcription factor 3 n=1 Tax=Madurella mycetomatis TaxID=100816 RepID=A0A175VPY5_9PEZI|nr:Oleate activated transcription factor 3 [Madurella mycetomatis]
MSASSSPASSPIQGAAKSSKACVCCQIKKKGCDKMLPSCGRCLQASHDCLHEEDLLNASGSVRAALRGRQIRSPIPPSLFEAINSAKDIDSFALTTVMDILDDRRGVERAVASYFGGVNTWFTIIEQARFEKQLSETLQKPSAEICILVLCMSMIARSPDPNSVSGMGDSSYHTAKALLSLVQSNAPMSTQLLQAELLVAMYEFSHGNPQQTYLTLGRCVQMTRAFGWHDKRFWSGGRHPRELKLCSILWWAIVYVDCLLNVGYEDQKYPMHTTSIGLDFVIPFPDAFDQYLSGGLLLHFDAQGKLVRDAHISQIGGMILPEANSAWYLSSVLQHLSNPGTLSVADLSTAITQHTTNLVSETWVNVDRNAAVGTNFIALMKLNQPSLFSIGPLPVSDLNNTRPIDTIRKLVTFIQQAAEDAAKSEARLSAGAMAPCWAFAMYNASLLLISHGDGVLQDVDWLRKVEHFKTLLKIFSKRWRIAGELSRAVPC